MVGLFPLIRFPRSFALLLVVALVTSAGCQIFSPKHSPPTPVIPPTTTPASAVVNAPSFLPSTSEQNTYSAFRPIMPEQSPAPVPVPAAPVTVAPLSESPSESPRVVPDTAAQSKIEELTRKITELEA